MVVDRAIGILRKRVARPLLQGLRRPYVLRQIASPSEAILFGHKLLTHPDVFHPVHFASSRVLAQHLLEGPLRGLHLLDMGTGAGPIAVVAAAAGAVVTACDINPRAVALARENSALNGLNTEVIESDLFAELRDRQFDLICFNLPFYARDAMTPLEAAFKAGRNLETVCCFARGCREHLRPNGRVVVLFSEDSDCDRMLRAFTEANLAVERRFVARRFLEDFHIVWFHRDDAVR
jgi:release factor glutamine methyltransferase